MIGFTLPSALVMILAASTTVPSSSAKPDCIDLDTQVRRTAYGYDHLATVSNGCATRMKCFVRTEAHSEQFVVELDRDEAETIVVLRGSPARRVETRASCKPDAEDGQGESVR